MYIKVKTMDGKESVMLTVSKMSLIEEVRQLVKDKLNVEPACQRLFFRGKQVFKHLSKKSTLSHISIIPRWKMVTV